MHSVILSAIAQLRSNINGAVPTSQFENRLREQALPDASHTLLYQTQMHYFDSSYPEGNFKRNQLLSSSMSLSPLCPAPMSDLHVSITTSFHHSFP